VFLQKKKGPVIAQKSLSRLTIYYTKYIANIRKKANCFFFRVAIIRPKTEDCPRTKNEDCNKTKNSTGIGPKKMRGALTRPKNVTGTGIGPRKKQ
jgi:hypothetical protein